MIYIIGAIAFIVAVVFVLALCNAAKIGDDAMLRDLENELMMKALERNNPK